MFLERGKESGLCVFGERGGKEGERILIEWWGMGCGVMSESERTIDLDGERERGGVNSYIVKFETL